MAKSFLVSPGRAYLVIAGEGTQIIRANGTLLDTVPEGANAVSITVDTHEIIVMDNSAKIQQLYNGNSGSSGVMLASEGEDTTGGSWKTEIVSALPEQGSAGVIYMLRTNRTGTDRYDDYIWIPGDNAYELLGRRPESSSVDLSNVAKTDVANIFNKSQQINGTLTATTVDVTRLSCEDSADIGTAVVYDLDYNTASGSGMTASHVTILTSLQVAPQAAVTLPGVAWRTGTDGDYIDITRKTLANTVEISGTAKVANVLTLGTGGIVLSGQHRTIEVASDDSSVRIETSCVHVLAPDTILQLKGDEISMQARTENRTLFSFAQTDEGKFVLNTSDGVILNGTISMPDTLTVNNLNVTGTVTGIPTGGGGGGDTTPTIDFSNGVTIMQTLTADDVVADTVTASTLSAGSSLSIASEAVIYKHSDGAIYVKGGIVNATRVEATTFVPNNIQGATFIGPLIMTKDNALQVWKSGNVADIRNGNITGFSYAQFDYCTITQSLAMEAGTARNVSVTDTLVVKDLIVTGTTTGIQGGGDSGEGDTPSDAPSVVEGDLWVNGTVTAMSVLASSIGLTGTDGRIAEFQYSEQGVSDVEVTLASIGGDATSIHFDTDHISADTVSAGSITLTGSAGTLSADGEEVEWINSRGRLVLNTDNLEMLTADGEHGLRLAVISQEAGSTNMQNVVLHGARDAGVDVNSAMVVLRVHSLQLGSINGSAAYTDAYPDDPATFMLALYHDDTETMYCLNPAAAYDYPATLELKAFNYTSSEEVTNTALRVPTLYADRIRAYGDRISVMSSLIVGAGLTVVDGMTMDEAYADSMTVMRSLEASSDFVAGGSMLKVSSDNHSVEIDTLTVVNALSVGSLLKMRESDYSAEIDRLTVVDTLVAGSIKADSITAPGVLTAEQRELLSWLAANKDALTNLIS